MQQAPNFYIKNLNFTEEEIQGIAKVHASEIGQGFLSSLGVAALTLLYKHIAESDNAVIYAAFKEGDSTPLGFICGTLDCGALYKDFLRRKGVRAACVFLPQLLTFRRLRNAFETLTYPTKMTNLPKPEILNFAICSFCRGTGLAEKLFRALMDYFSSRGVPEAKIVTGDNQLRAQKFYEKMGARKVGSTTVHRGRTALIYVYDLR